MDPSGPGDGLVVYDYSLVGPIAGVALATLVYILIDAFLRTKAFGAVFRTPAFYLLWVIHSMLALLSYGALQVTTWEKMLGVVGHEQLARLLQVLVAVLGSLTVLQNFSLRISDVKIVDLGQLADRYRIAVYEAIGEEVVKSRKRRGQMIAARLAARFSADHQRLREELTALLRFSEMGENDIGLRLGEIDGYAAATKTSAGRAYATEIVLLDRQRAEDLAK